MTTTMRNSVHMVAWSSQILNGLERCVGASSLEEEAWHHLSWMQMTMEHFGPGFVLLNETFMSMRKMR